MLDVIILNAYHRGDRLIKSMQALGKSYEVLDVSAVIGERSLADMQGPFGIFMHPQNLESQWLLETQKLSPQSSGWTVWSDEGTYESQGLFADYQRQNLPMVLSNFFKSWWSNVDRPLRMLETVALPELSHLQYMMPDEFLQSSQFGHQIKAEDILKISEEPGMKRVLWNEKTFEAQYVISFLLPHEVMALADRGFSRLLRGEALKPRLAWQRARFSLKGWNFSQMPRETLVVPQSQNPWINENFMVLKKRESGNDSAIFDVWFRTWFDVHTVSGHYAELSSRIQRNLRGYFPGADFSELEKPAEIDSAVQTLFPIYDLHEQQLQKKWYAAGVFSGSVEKSESYLSLHTAELQGHILKQLDEELKGG